MHVIRSADRDDVDVLAMLGEQFAVVGEPLRALEFLRIPLALERVAVDVADRDHVAEEGGVVGIAAPLAPHADAGDVQLLSGRVAPGGAAARSDEIAGAGQGCGLQEIATCGCWHARVLFVIRA